MLSSFGWRLKNTKTLSEKRVEEKKKSSVVLRSSSKNELQNIHPAIPVYHNCSFTGDRPQFCMLLHHRGFTVNAFDRANSFLRRCSPIFGESKRVTILMDQLKIPPSNPLEAEIVVGPPIISNTRSSSSSRVLSTEEESEKICARGGTRSRGDRDRFWTGQQPRIWK